MGNSNMELDIRLQQVERMLENYKSTIEPKSGEFIGQHWYDTSTEVLNVWNGREFTPAYGNSIITTIEGYETRISQNEYAINFEVVNKDEVLSAINLSSEGVRILGDKIQLDGDVYVDGTFTLSSLGDLDDLPDGSTYKRVTSNEKTGADRAYGALNSSDRYKQWLVNTDLISGSNPYTGIVFDSSGIRGYYQNSETFNINATTGDAFFKGEIAATSGTITGDLTVTYGGSLFVGGTGTGLFIQNGVGGPGLDFYDGNQGVGFIEGTYQKAITLGGNTYYLDCIGVSKDFYVGRDLIVQDDLVVGDDLYVVGDVVGTIRLTGSADLDLTGTGNRIKSGTGEIYYNGSVWRKYDSVNGWTDL